MERVFILGDKEMKGRLIVIEGPILQDEDRK